MAVGDPGELRYPVHPLAALLSFEATLSQYEIALARLQDWGLQPSPTSRIARYRDLLRESVERDPPYAPQRDLERLSFVLLEISEIIEIVEAFEPPTPRARCRLALLVKGGVHPDDETSSPARDAQYELWLCAFLRRKRLPCLLGDPDLRLRWKGTTVPLEAKRPGSMRSLNDRYRKALHQLDPYPQGGIVAISLDLMLRPRGKVLYAQSPLEASNSMDLLFLDQVKALISQDSPLTKRGVGRNAIGFFFTAKLPAFIREHGAFAAEFRQELLWAESDPRREILTGLRSVISSYAPGDGGAAS
jgi:hypothetical protein